MEIQKRNDGHVQWEVKKPRPNIEVGKDMIMISKTMRLLEMRFDDELSWNVHLEDVTNKSKKMMSGQKVNRHHLTQDQLSTLVACLIKCQRGTFLHSGQLVLKDKSGYSASCRGRLHRQNAMKNVGVVD